jgi:hypothetical protein
VGWTVPKDPDTLLHEAQAEARSRRPVRVARLFLIGSITAAVLLVAVVAASYMSARHAESLAEQLQQANQAATRAVTVADQGKALAREIKAACGDPTTAALLGTLCDKASDVAQQPGPIPPVTTPDTVIAAQVALYCAQHSDCSGVRQSDVVYAVVQYCAGKGGCAGPAGAQGSPGTNGTNGSGPTNAQVAAVVASYCTAHNSCQGPQGSPGPTGPPGPRCGPGYTATVQPMPTPPGGSQEVCTSPPASPTSSPSSPSLLGP